LSLGFQVIYAGRRCSLSRQGHCIAMCLVAGHAQWMSMASRTTYSTWTPQKPTLFDGHYLHNRSILDIGVLGYIGIVQHKEHSPEVLSIPPGTPCICEVWFGDYVRNTFMKFLRRICLHLKEYEYSIVSKFELYLTCFQAVGINFLYDCSRQYGT